MNAPRHAAQAIALALGFTFVIVPVPVAPANYNLDWHVIDGVDVMLSTAGNVDVSGTIGPHDAGATPAGGNFEIIGGSRPVGVETLDGYGDLDVDRSDLAQLLGN